MEPLEALPMSDLGYVPELSLFGRSGLRAILMYFEVGEAVPPEREGVPVWLAVRGLLSPGPAQIASGLSGI